MTQTHDRTWDHVTFLADERLKGRVPRSEGNRIAREYILDAFMSAGLVPAFANETSYLQEIITGKHITGTNVGGILKGKTNRYIILGAHYDHVGHSPGADDNAAAVAEMLSTIEMVVNQGLTPSHSILFIAFDCEEPPYFHSNSMGSVFFYNDCPIPRESIDVAIILDLTGHEVPIKGLENCLFILGAENTLDLYEKVHLLTEPGLQVFFTRNDRIGDLSDHHVFNVNGKPFLFLTCGHSEHYHAPTDTIENLDKGKMESISRFLVSLLRSCDGSPPFNLGNMDDKFKEEEARQLTSLLGKPVSVDEVESIIRNLQARL